MDKKTQLKNEMEATELVLSFVKAAMHDCGNYLNVITRDVEFVFFLVDSQIERHTYQQRAVLDEQPYNITTMIGFIALCLEMVFEIELVK